MNGHQTNGEKPLNNVVIVGGSLGGLCTGLALKRQGIKTTILERTPSELLHNQGAGIVAGGDTLDFFKRYDRCGRPIGVSASARDYYNKAGEIVHTIGAKHNMTSWDLAYYLLRANYDGVKSDYCELPKTSPSDGPVSLLNGHTFTDVKEEGDGVRIFFKRNDGSEDSMLADLLIAADGPSSTIRKKFAPEVQRKYVGYCALRGTVPENEASEAALKAFRDRFAFYHDDGIQILLYLIPGPNGALEEGNRLINFVYYTNFPEGSDFDEIMTDSDGKLHRITMPPGKTSEKAWEKQKQRARERLPPQFSEIVCGTKKPFVQAITDVITPTNHFLNGKVILIGDALAGFRPHTVASTSQAAFDAMVLADMLEGKISREEWRQQTMAFARVIQKRGAEAGDRSQFGNLPLSEMIEDRNVLSKPRREEVWPEWAKA